MNSVTVRWLLSTEISSANAASLMASELGARSVLKIKLVLQCAIGLENRNIYNFTCVRLQLARKRLYQLE